MDNYLLKSLVSNLSLLVSVLAIFISALALKFNKKSAKEASFYKKGSYNVFFRGRLFQTLRIKIYSGLISDYIDTGFNIQIVPKTGGFHRVIMFDGLNINSIIGISENKLISKKLETRKEFRKYAYQYTTFFISSSIFPYFEKDWKLKNKEVGLRRYNKYIEITDFLGNSEIWYFSFSLILSTKKDKNYRWKKHRGKLNKDMYYRISDYIIFSPKDLIENINFISENYNLKLSSLESEFDEECDLEKISRELKLYEINEYLFIY